MNQKIKNRFFLALGISLVLTACNQSDKKDEETKTTDSTITAKTEEVQPAVPDAVTAAPNLYKVAADTMGIRIVEVTYKPGDSSAWHAHPDYAVYATEGGTATFYGKDGAKMESEMKKGTIMVKPGDVVTLRNRPNIRKMYNAVGESSNGTSAEWINFDKASMKAIVTTLPTIDDVMLKVEVGQVVVFMSR